MTAATLELVKNGVHDQLREIDYLEYMLKVSFPEYKV